MISFFMLFIADSTATLNAVISCALICSTRLGINISLTLQWYASASQSHRPLNFLRHMGSVQYLAVLMLVLILESDHNTSVPAHLCFSQLNYHLHQ